MRGVCSHGNNRRRIHLTSELTVPKVTFHFKIIVVLVRQDLNIPLISCELEIVVQIRNKYVVGMLSLCCPTRVFPPSISPFPAVRLLAAARDRAMSSHHRTRSVPSFPSTCFHRNFNGIACYADLFRREEHIGELSLTTSIY